jgi:hypothetical protein
MLTKNGYLSNDSLQLELANLFCGASAPSPRELIGLIQSINSQTVPRRLNTFRLSSGMSPVLQVSTGTLASQMRRLKKYPTFCAL